MSLATPYYVLGMTLSSLTQVPPVGIFGGIVTSGFLMWYREDSILMCMPVLAGVLLWTMYNSRKQDIVSAGVHELVFIYASILFRWPFLSCMSAAWTRNRPVFFMSFAVYVLTVWILPKNDSLEALVPLGITYIEYGWNWFTLRSLMTENR